MLVDVDFVEAFAELVSLDALKAAADGELDGMLVVRRGQRLSVQPVDKAHFSAVLQLAKPRPASAERDLRVPGWYRPPDEPKYEAVDLRIYGVSLGDGRSDRLRQVGRDRGPRLSNEESLVGSRDNYDSEDEEQTLDQSYGKREELPPLQEPVEKCTGKGKTRECKTVDPQPEVTAARGARKLIGRFRWGMDVRRS